MSIEQVYLKRDITPLIQFLKLRDEPVLAGQIYHSLKSEYLSELANAWREHIQPDVYFKLINWSNR